MNDSLRACESDNLFFVPLFQSDLVQRSPDVAVVEQEPRRSKRESPARILWNEAGVLPDSKWRDPTKAAGEEESVDEVLDEADDVSAMTVEEEGGGRGEDEEEGPAPEGEPVDGGGDEEHWCHQCQRDVAFVVPRHNAPCAVEDADRSREDQQVVVHYNSLNHWADESREGLFKDVEDNKIMAELSDNTYF